MTAPAAGAGGVDREAAKAAAEYLISTHWDGRGCGNDGAGGCSRCYGPSPADAFEVAEDVIEVARPLIEAPLLAALAAAEQRVRAVETLHKPAQWYSDPLLTVPSDVRCDNDDQEWPCATAAALSSRPVQPDTERSET